MKRKAILFSAIWMLCSMSIQPLAQPPSSQYRFEHFDTKNGLSSDLTEQIFQDSLGFLWVTHIWSVSRYDGYSFRTYRYDPDDTIRSLGNEILGAAYLDQSGNFWIGSTNAKDGFQINQYDRTIDGFRKYRIFTDQHVVWKVSFEKDNKTLWLSTDNGIYRFNTETNETNHFFNYVGDPLKRPDSNMIRDISVTDSSLLVATKNGMWTFDKTLKIFSRPACSLKDSVWIYDTEFFDIYDERSTDFNNVWLLDDNSLTRIGGDHSVIQRLVFPNGMSKRYLRGYDTDEDGVFWFGSWFKGLFRCDASDSTFKILKHAEDDPYSLRTDRVSDAMVDRDQNVWVATYRGISKLPKSSLHFYNFDIKEARIDQSLVYEAGGSEYVVIDWNTDRHKLMSAPLIRGQLESFKFKELTRGFEGEQVNGFWKGRRKFWVTSWGTGLVGFPIDEKSGMIKSSPMTIFSHSPTNPNTISTNRTICVWEDEAENVWVGTSGGGLNKIVAGIPYGSEASVIRYQHSDIDSTSLADDSVPYLFPENDKDFWVATRISIELFSNNRFGHFFLNRQLPSGLLKNRQGLLFVGTGSGLFEARKHENGYMFIKSPLVKNSDILNMKEDQLGRLWIVTGEGLTFYDPVEKIAIAFNDTDGFKHHRVYNSSLNPALTSSGIMVMSDFSGLTLFEPSTIRINRKKTSPLLTRLTVNNELPVSGSIQEKQQFSINSDISILSQLTLDHQHNNFSLEFSAMELTSPEKNLYRHKLEGYDRDWIETDHKSRTATYTNLDAGKYVFRVKASNYHGIWSDNETTLSVVILPPPWKTWWAYSIYGLLLVGVILYWRSYEMKRLKLKQRAAYLSEIDQVKTRFFANISHEFRTPITLILGPLKELYNGTFEGDQRTLFATMMRNGQRLLRLVNQLLDLSKIEAGKMQLHPCKVELVEFLRDIAAAYESLAAEKGIRYTFKAEVPVLVVFLDKEKIEKVIHNLLSNAFKFTEAGDVMLTLRRSEKGHAMISVSDTGRGIPHGELSKVFDRFYQVDSSQTRAYEGSGLGMALARELVELHQGKISVESTEGEGTTFIVWLPLGKEESVGAEGIHRDAHQKVEVELEHLLPSGDFLPAENGNGKPLRPSQERPVLLIVEDNTDMRSYIRKTLYGQYQILEALNGKDGVQKAEETLPDLIISDVMMPEMDGYRLCEIIKTNELTSHIPVILLTAKADHESKLTGLATGADDYLSKPFDADELKLIVRNRIEHRRKMREKFSREITLEPRHIAISSLDEKLLSKVMALIEKHMADEKFSIETLSKEVGYSHMQFIRKIKALFGQTPSHFLRTIRLKRAATLLSARADNISQIAFMVGFNSLPYFNKCFKEQFGVTPGKFAESKKACSSVIQISRDKNHDSDDDA